MPNIIILNYGMGNIRNVQRGFEKAGLKAQIISKEADLRDPDAIILPGVGAFRDAISNLAPYMQQIGKKVEAGIPLLGICLGLQLLFTESTEGGLYKGLNLLKGRILRLPKGLKVPQIGWNTLKIVDPNNPLVEGVRDGSYVYFVHSYYAELRNEEGIVAITNYGIVFPSIISRNNIYATQFHPEKSGKTGLKILENFVDLVKR